MTFMIANGTATKLSQGLSPVELSAALDRLLAGSFAGVNASASGLDGLYGPDDEDSATAGDLPWHMPGSQVMTEFAEPVRPFEFAF